MRIWMTNNMIIRNSNDKEGAENSGLRNKSDSLLYKDFIDIYDKEWKRIDGGNKELNQNRKAFLVVFFIFIISFSIVIILSLALLWLKIAGWYLLAFIVGAFIFYRIERICFNPDEDEINERKIECMENTICKFTGCKEMDIEEKLLFTETFDNISKGSCRYIGKTILRCVICVVFAFEAVFITKMIEYKQLDNTIIGILLIVAVQIVFSPDFLNSFLFTSDLNYQRIVKEYRKLLLQKHLDKKEWGLPEKRASFISKISSMVNSLCNKLFMEKKHLDKGR